MVLCLRGTRGVCWLGDFRSALVSFVFVLEWGCGGFSLSRGKLGPMKLAFGGGGLAN